MSRFGAYEYDPFLAEVYDHIPHHQARADVEFYVSLARAAGGRTLELGCGTGRILIPTAQATCDIVGLELSPHMLTKCREKLGRQPPNVQARARLVQGNMTDFELGETFALATTPFRSFQQLLTVEEQFSSLGCVRRHLQPGGRLVLDVFQVDFRYMKPSDAEVEDFADAPLPDGRRLSRHFRVAAVHRAEQ
ncbi:MAG: class I SAM-dependent methyltransferase [Terriglobia bacterium]